MKRTYFIALMASILGMNTYAGIVPTTVTGATNYNPIGYVGEYSTEEAVSGGDVSIEADAAGEDLSFTNVLGGFTTGEGATASENSVYMAGGCVADLYGADACGDASQNSIIMEGGQAESLSARTHHMQTPSPTVLASQGER